MKKATMAQRDARDWDVLQCPICGEAPYSDPFDCLGVCSECYSTTRGGTGMSFSNFLVHHNIALVPIPVECWGMTLERDDD